MAFNKISSFFSKGKKKQLSETVEDGDRAIPPVRRYSLSKSGRMRAKEITRTYMPNSELVRSKSMNAIDSTEDDTKIEDVIKEMEELSRAER